jgi:hypothetical protein
MGHFATAKILGVLGIGSGGATLLTADSFAQSQPVVTVALAGLAFLIPLAVKYVATLIGYHTKLLQDRMAANHKATIDAIQGAALAAAVPPQTAAPVLTPPPAQGPPTA